MHTHSGVLLRLLPRFIVTILDLDFIGSQKHIEDAVVLTKRIDDAYISTEDTTGIDLQVHILSVKTSQGVSEVQVDHDEYKKAARGSRISVEVRPSTMYGDRFEVRIHRNFG